ncbi:hypothetical protein [uncultured Akkermansia sp.]|jgi:hypothetical protein|uniref:hypothetical protein n=1 Tax=Akkermansia sp. TaxID=1872421 RepID=UPI00266C37EE|nr:hypothetical protein [uncultured Akkermansia sp.]
MINYMNKKKYSIQLPKEGKPASMLQASVFSGFNTPFHQGGKTGKSRRTAPTLQS